MCIKASTNYGIIPKKPTSGYLGREVGGGRGRGLRLSLYTLQHPLIFSVMSMNYLLENTNTYFSFKRKAVFRLLNLIINFPSKS